MATASTPALDRAGSAPAQVVLLTAEGERAMRDELERLRQELEVDLVARLKEAREYGAGSENDEMQQLREEEAILAARIARLEDILARAQIVEGDAGADVVTIGSRVRVKDAASGKEKVLRLVGGHEPGEAGSVSASAPVGQALLGAEPGMTVSVLLPSGKRKKLEVVSVEA